MNYGKRIRLTLLTLLTLGCTTPDLTGPRSLPTRAHMGYLNTEAPVPTLIAVERVASANGLDELAVTFADNATDETLTTVYITDCAVFAATESIKGDAETGVQTVTVSLPSGFCRARLVNSWIVDPLNPDLTYHSVASSWVDITEAVTVTTTKRKGKGGKP